MWHNHADSVFQLKTKSQPQMLTEIYKFETNDLKNVLNEEEPVWRDRSMVTVDLAVSRSLVSRSCKATSNIL